MKHLIFFAFFSAVLPLFALRPGDKVGNTQFKLKWIDCTPFKIGELSKEDKAVTPPFRVLVFLFTRSESSDHVIKILEDTRRAHRKQLQIAVITPDTEHDARLFRKKHPDVRVRLAVDSERKLTPLFMAGSMLYPMAFVCDADGKIIWNGEAVDLPEAVQNILQKKNDVAKQRKIALLLDDMQQHMRTGGVRALRQLSEKIFKLSPADPSALRMILFVLENSGNSMEAWQVLENRIKSAPATLRLYYTAMDMIRRYPELQIHLPRIVNGFYTNAVNAGQQLFFSETLLHNFSGNIAVLEAVLNNLPKVKDSAALNENEQSRFFSCSARLRYLLGDLPGAIANQQKAVDSAKKSGDDAVIKMASKQLEFYLKLQMLGKKNF